LVKEWSETCPICKIKLSAESESELRALKEHHTYICGMFEKGAPGEWGPSSG
jgi:hypothetical protein